MIFLANFVFTIRSIGPPRHLVNSALSPLAEFGLEIEFFEVFAADYPRIERRHPKFENQSVAHLASAIHRFVIYYRCHYLLVIIPTCTILGQASALDEIIDGVGREAVGLLDILSLEGVAKDRLLFGALLALNDAWHIFRGNRATLN